MGHAGGVVLEDLRRILPHAQLVGDAGVRVCGIAIDHREVRPGDVFGAIPGQHVDGRSFVPAAIERGASAVLVPDAPLPVAVSQLVVPNGKLRRSVGIIAHRLCGDPSRELGVVGVTGTNGKTTTVSVISQALERLGERVGVMGTLWGRLTTPEAPEIARRLARFREEGARWAAMEVSSIAVSMERIAGLRVKVGVFTNLSQDHLDFHGTMEAYFEAKAALFVPEITEVAVVNADDAWGERLLGRLRIPAVAVRRTELRDVEVDAAGIRFRRGALRYRSRLVGEHNLTNLQLAISVLELLGFSPEAVCEAVADVESPRGRMQRIRGPHGVVVVDYAHSPEALRAVLRAARLLAGPRGRLSVVFGAGGERDQAKRPLMGQIAEELADSVVVTSDNPRSEDPAAIAAQIVAGMRDPRRAQVVLDRRLAIEEAIAALRPGDVLVVAGKGHEQVQIIDSTSMPFDDIEVVMAALGDEGGLLA